MKHIKIFFKIALIVVSSIGSIVQGQNSQKEVGSLIKADKLEHPYLLFDNKGKEQLLETIKSDRELSEIYSKQLLLANRNLKLPIKKEWSLPLERSRIYDRGETLSTLNSYLDAAVNLAFVYQLTNNTDYATKAYEYGEILCKLDSWVYSFHQFENIYSRVWPWNVNDDQVVFSYDLQSARTATKLALIYDWLYPVLEKGQRNRIRGALLENAITRVRGNYEYHWWATAYRCNWSGICHSGVGLAALALLKEDPHLLDVVDISYNGVESMINEIGVDGGWQEGRGYWAYGLSHSSWFMEAVNRLTEGNLNLFVHDKIRNNPVDFPLYTLGSDFGDGRGTPVGSSWFLNKLISETNNTTAAFYREKYIKTEESIFDLLWVKSNVKPIEPDAKSKHFKTIDWAVLQDDFYSDDVFSIICKAGMNDDPHHGHLDCGQFILNYNGHQFIKDYGHPAYDDYYFSAPRWEYVLASSKGHNLILVNDEEQKSSKLKDQDWDENVGGNITAFKTTESSDYLSMDLTNAYPGKELKFWQRQIFLEKPQLSLVIDNIKAKRGSEIKSRIHPDGNIEVKDGYYTIEYKGDKLAVIPLINQKYEIETGRDGSLPVKIGSNLEWIPHIDIITESIEENTLMGMLIFPMENEVTPSVIINSIVIKKSKNNELNVSFHLKEKLYNYSFVVQGKEKRLVLQE
jgi:hypothetical protein